MNGKGEIDLKRTKRNQAIELSYIRFDPSVTVNTSSTIVLSSCSSDDDDDDDEQATPPLKWKRQKILNHHTPNPSNEPPEIGDDPPSNPPSEQILITPTKEDFVVPVEDEHRIPPLPRRLPPIPADKLHRRNPNAVRQELKNFDEFIPETSLADVHLSEMPGLHNTEQWKRIAGQTAHASPPLPRQYYQTDVSTIGAPDGQVPQALGSYRRPGRTEEEQDRTTSRSRWRAPRRRIFFGSSVAVVVVAIVVGVVLAVTLAQKTSQPTSDYYSGSASVRARFDPVLLNPSSTLARNYKRQFCTLIGTTLADTRTRYALYYSTCSVINFRNGSIIVDFVLGFTHPQNVTRLSSFLNRTLINQELFGGIIVSVGLNFTQLNQNSTSNSTDDDYDYDDSNKKQEEIMNEQNLTNDPLEPTRTTYTTVTYTKLDKGLSITISETITITNNNNATNTTENKNYELILVPSIDDSKTIVIPTDDNNQRSILPTTTTMVAPTSVNNVLTKSPSLHHLQTLKSIRESSFAYIDDSSDERTFSSGDVNSTLEDLTTRDSTSSPSTISFNEEAILNSTSTLVNNPTQPTRETSTRPTTTGRFPPPPLKNKDDESKEKPQLSRPYLHTVKRNVRMIPSKNQRRLLQYELMPTGKIYYIDRPNHHEKKISKDDTDDNSSAVLSTILSRSSSLDTLSDKQFRRRHHYQQHQQQHTSRFHPDLTVKKPEEKLSIGGRLASNSNLPSTSSPFKPIHGNKKKRFSSFDPTPESLDRVFDVLIAADKRREEHEFWREKFDLRQSSTRLPPPIGRAHETANANTIPSIRAKPTRPTPATSLNPIDIRSQSYAAKRTPSYDKNHQRSDCLFEDCLRRRTLVLQQQQQRNYSPNVIYSTNYPKAELTPTGKPPLPTNSTTNQQPIRILPLSNGRVSRAPQARQTSDELSSASDVWATRSSVEEDTPHLKKTGHHARFQSTINRHRINEQRPLSNKRASSVEQQKSNRIPTKSSTTTKNKFFDLFKFNR